MAEILYFNKELRAMAAHTKMQSMEKPLGRQQDIGQIVAANVKAILNAREKIKGSVTKWMEEESKGRITSSTAQRILNGHQGLSIANLAALATFLKVPPWLLLVPDLYFVLLDERPAKEALKALSGVVGTYVGGTPEARTILDGQVALISRHNIPSFHPSPSRSQKNNPYLG